MEMENKLYFGRLTLYDSEGKIYEIRNTRVTRAIPELNRILQARGNGEMEILLRGVG